MNNDGKIKLNSVKNKSILENTMVLFPKGPAPIKGVFSLEFGSIVNQKNSVVARYKMIPINEISYKDMVQSLKPSFGRGFSLIPGITSVFFVPPATNCLEYTVSIGNRVAMAYFQTAKDLNIKTPSIISIDLIKGIIKSHIARFHQF